MLHMFDPLGHTLLLFTGLGILLFVCMFAWRRSHPTIDTYATIQGPPGPPGPEPELSKVAVYCTDPQDPYCRFPAEKQGVDLGKTKLYSTDNGTKLVLDTSNKLTLTSGDKISAEFDPDAGIRWSRKDGRQTQWDTPGGDERNVIPGPTTFDDAVEIAYTLDLGNNWTIDTSSGNFELKYNNANQFVTRSDGTLWQGWYKGANICGCINDPPYFSRDDF